jgi:hypothetical protein
MIKGNKGGKMNWKFAFLAGLFLAVPLGTSNCQAADKHPFPLRPAPENKAQDTFESKLQRAPKGIGLKLTLRDGTKLRGRLESSSSQDFSIRIFDGDNIITRTIQYDQVKKLSFSNNPGAIGSLIAGTILGTALLTVIILAATSVI